MPLARRYPAEVNARIWHPEPTEGAAARTVQRRDGKGAHNVRDEVACEVPVALHYNDQPFAVLMATPCDLADLAVGFSLSEALIPDAGELQIEAIDESIDGIAIRMRIPEPRHAALADRQRALPGYGSCGICGSTSIEAVLRAPPRIASTPRIAETALHRALDALHECQPLNAATGATHAAGFADRSGTLLLVREDVGRHNALDKLVGAMATQGIDAGSDRGLRTIVERAGLSWAEAREALKDEAWRLTAETNREELFALGLWGVPSFRVGDTAVWGQDRLWAVRDALLERARPAPAANQAP